MAQALPTYKMSCFKLPITLFHEIEALIHKLFWGQRGDNRKIHWLKWETMCKPKSQGGLGFKDLYMYNNALLTKQTWWLLHNTQSLFYWVLKAKLFPNCSVMEAKNPNNASNAWKSILKGRDVIKRGASWRIGTGTSVNILGDNWLPTKNNPRVISPEMSGLPVNKVSNLIDPVQRVWKDSVLDRYFFEFEAAVIMVSLSKVWTSSICWVLFLLKIGTLNCLLRWFRWFGIVQITSGWANPWCHWVSYCR